jgi:hypothetical protein
MSTQSDYYTRRALAERILSGLTTDPKVAAIHLDMARRYDALSSSDGQAPTQKPTRRIGKTARRLEP